MTKKLVSWGLVGVLVLGVAAAGALLRAPVNAATGAVIPNAANPPVATATTPAPATSQLTSVQPVSADKKAPESPEVAEPAESESKSDPKAEAVGTPSGHQDPDGAQVQHEFEGQE